MVALEEEKMETAQKGEAFARELSDYEAGNLELVSAVFDGVQQVFLAIWGLKEPNRTAARCKCIDLRGEYSPADRQ